MFLLTITLKLTRSSSWFAYIQAQVTFQRRLLPEYCRTPSISNQKFKGMERTVGKEIEQVAEKSCKKWKGAELEKEKTGPQQGKLKGSFDVSWRKQRGYNSLVGHRAIFGYHTKSVLITELRTLIAEHANNQCEWVNKQMSTFVIRTTAEVLKLWRLVFQRSISEKETTVS